MSESLFNHVLNPSVDPGRGAIELADGGRVTYGELRAASGRMANAITAAGVRPGDRVAVQVEKSLEALVLYLGCLRSGAVYLPLNTAYTPAELGYFIGDAEPALVVCDPARLEATAPMAGDARLLTLDAQGRGSLADAMAGQPDDFATVACGTDDLAAILYTSGTTGRSKGAMLTQGNLLTNAQVLRAEWRFTPEDVLLHALPLFHTHGLFVACNVALMAGATTILLPRFDPAAMLERLPRSTVMMGVPTFYTRLLGQDALTADLCRSVRLFVSGSAPLLAETHRAWESRTSHRILERYGMTETGMLTSNPYDGDRIAGTVGLPLPGVEARIADPQTGALLPDGEIGVVEVKGPNVFKGYWRMPEKTAAEFRADGFFITGDLGRIDERGYLHIVGRGKDLIISGGFNVYPKEVEGEIDALPGVLESAVVGVPHPDFGEGVVAVLVPDHSAPITEAAVTAALTERLARYKQPKRVIVVDELPRNSMGKVQKALLRERHAGIFQ
ncbi:malonate--CoA ligase [Azospirillum soli]|uniref:malonate--CoA ligase n=1 Tax=Azospirillum soli TaxID=1304799 RepID=UPI001AE63A52|nr:malonyl-CoA synthase [Azospirillum soli]MBP2314325.1 malonyl-CoA/methylmalonyl-CoA synthetase [Azospirillum soli]